LQIFAFFLAGSPPQCASLLVMSSHARDRVQPPGRVALGPA